MGGGAKRPQPGSIIAEQPIGLLIGACRRAMKKLVWSRLTREGVTPQQCGAILAIAHGEEGSCRSVAARLHVDEPTFTRLIDRLERAGLCRRTRDSSDRRCWRVALTAAGRRKADLLETLVRAFDREMTAGLGPSEIVRLKALLAKLLATLDAKGQRFEKRATNGRPAKARAPADTAEAAPPKRRARGKANQPPPGGTAR